MIYVTGDTHGDIKRFDSPKLKRLGRDDTLIICGDFGFLWDNTEKEKKILKKLGKKKYNICFIDGTHENFDLLDSFEELEWNGGRVHGICGNVRHLMRGQVYRIEDLRVFTMGGGESPDIDMRFDLNAWSRREIPSRSELLEGVKNLDNNDGNVDLVITHEPPLKIKGFLKLKDKCSPRVTVLNSYFEELSETCTFRRWFFGSMHIDKHISSTHTAVFQNIVNARTGETL